MTYNPFLFLKSYQERLDDFNYVLSNSLKTCEIEKGWSDYLEFAIEPVGWKAIWRISREICADYKINFPCTVIIMVEHVNFKDLSCLVAINEVEHDNIHLPEKMADVPLIELYPAKEQEISCALAMYETASLIDSLRFFYHHLWMPWDLEFDEEIPWIDAHLEGRLKLHFSLLELQVPEEVIYEVRKLVAEGRQTLQHIEDLVDSELEAELSSGRLLELTELHNRLSQLKNTYAVYEKPHLLQALIERHQSRKDSKSVTTVVLSTTSPEQLSNLSTHLPADTKQIRLVPTLQEALVKTSPEGSVCVTQGEHLIQDLASLKTGGSLSGLESGVVLVGDISGEDCATLDLLKGCLALSRFTLRMTSSWIIIKVRPGTKCSLKDVQLQGSSVTDGVDVHPGATFSAVGCAFASCQTALVCYPNSNVTLSHCTFTDNNIAIELREGCQFSMVDCTISGSSVCAVNVLHPPPLMEGNQQQPTVETINSISQLKESGTVCKNNTSDIRFLKTARQDPCNGDCVSGEEKVMECSF